MLPTVSIATVEQKTVIANLLQYYLYDFSEFSPTEINSQGSFDYPYLDHYWRDPDRTPYLFCLDNRPMGFALVRVETDPGNGEKWMDLAEFFVLRPYRRLGYGSTLAASVWNLHPDRWQVRLFETNKVAYPFWKRVIDDFTDGEFRESAKDKEFVFEFESSRTI